MEPQAPAILNHSAAGNRRGPALLLIHPLGADLRFWDGCVARMGGAHFCVACDLRPAGASPPAAGPVTIDEHVADLDRVREHLGLAHVVPVGCAVGAMVACAYAARHAGRALALVLANPDIRITPEGGEVLRRRAEAVRRGGMQAVLPDAVDNAFFGEPRDERYHRYVERFAAQDPQTYALAALGVAEADISADAARVRCPSLIVAGDQDRLLPPWHADALAALLPGAEQKTIQGGAHFIPYQAPAAFAHLVTRFLGGAEPRRGATPAAVS